MREYIVTSAADLVRLAKRIENPAPLLKQMGAMLASDAKASFDRQALGDIAWPERYPGQRAPFINIAGAVADFAVGRKAPLSRRFDARPAGLDTGDTRRRITFAVIPPDGVEVGSTSEQAQRLQSGGESKQPVSADTRARIKAFIGKGKKRGVFVPKDVPIEEARAALGLKKNAKRNKAGELVVEDPNPYRAKLMFLTLPATTSLTTKVHARPFLGVTDTMKGDLIRATEDFLATGSV